MVQIVTKYDVRSGAVASKHDPDVVYVDPRIPPRYRPFLAIHEVKERHAMLDDGRTYLDAHENVATPAEKKAVEEAGLNWEEYTHSIDGFLDEIENSPAPNPPPDPHVNIDDAIGHHRHHRNHIVSDQTDKNPVGDKKSVAAVSMRAMSLNLPDLKDHPNRMPFSGVLTRIGEPSDSAPEGSGGRRVMITAEAAKKALDSLLGMGVDYQPNFDGHDPKAKIGVITAADIEGDAIAVKGIIYAADFPDIAAQIKANKSYLGMSFEARDLWTNNADADVMPIVDCVFTGAAILLKDKAAYRTTSIAAKAAQTDFDKDLIMSEEIKKQLADLAAAMTKVSDAVAAQGEKISKFEQEKVEAANHLAKVERHAQEMEKAAEHMDAAGIGGDPDRGHVRILRDMAGDVRAQAAQGRIPAAFYSMRASAEKSEPKVEAADAVKAAVEAAKAEFTKQIDEMKAAAAKVQAELEDKVKASETKVADLKAAADKAKVSENATIVRKTLTPGQSALLAKAGVQVPTDGGKLELAKLDEVFASAQIPTSKRMELKTALARLGAID